MWILTPPMSRSTKIHVDLDTPPGKIQSGSCHPPGKIQWCLVFHRFFILFSSIFDPRQAKERPREAKGRPRGAQGVHRERKGGPSKAQEGRKGAKGNPKEGQERPKGGPGKPKGAQRSPKWLTFWGSQTSKRQENQKRAFSKTELSFESGAHFQREGRQARKASPSLAKARQAFKAR